MSMSDKKLNSLSFLFDPPPPPPPKTKVTKCFVMLLSKHMILIVHNTKHKQKSKLNYVHCGEVYLVDLTEEKITKFLWTVQGLALMHDHITILCI